VGIAVVAVVIMAIVAIVVAAVVNGDGGMCQGGVVSVVAEARKAVLMLGAVISAVKIVSMGIVAVMVIVTVVVVVVPTTELAEEGEVDDTGHVRRGHRRGDHAHDEHDGVRTVCVGLAFEEAPAAGTDEDLVLRPEACQWRQTRERDRADQEGLVGRRHELAHAWLTEPAPRNRQALKKA